MARLWRNYNLSIVLAALFLVSWLLQAWTGWMHFAAEQQALGETAEVFGASGYVWRWSEATFENWQSEFLQLLTFVVLTSFLIHRGSHESKDSTTAMERTLARIENRFAHLEMRPSQATPSHAANGSSTPPIAAGTATNGHRDQFTT
jgi:hypothetical protein